MTAQEQIRNLALRESAEFILACYNPGELTSWINGEISDDEFFDHWETSLEEAYQFKTTSKIVELIDYLQGRFEYAIKEANRIQNENN
jgi:hypothetical protein